VFEQKFSKFPNVPILQGDDGKGPKLPFKEMRIKSFRGTDGKDHKFEGFEVETSFPARMGTIVPPRQFDRWIAGKTQNLSRLKKNAVTEAVDYTKGLVGSLPVQEEDFFQVCGRPRHGRHRKSHLVRRGGSGVAAHPHVYAHQVGQRDAATGAAGRRDQEV